MHLLASLVYVYDLQAGCDASIGYLGELFPARHFKIAQRVKGFQIGLNYTVE